MAETHDQWRRKVRVLNGMGICSVFCHGTPFLFCHGSPFLDAKGEHFDDYQEAYDRVVAIGRPVMYCNQSGGSYEDIDLSDLKVYLRSEDTLKKEIEMRREDKTRVLFGDHTVTVAHNEVDDKRLTLFKHFNLAGGCTIRDVFKHVGGLKRPIMYRRDITPMDGEFEDIDIMRFCVKLRSDAYPYRDKE